MVYLYSLYACLFAFILQLFGCVLYVVMNVGTS